MAVIIVKHDVLTASDAGDAPLSERGDRLRRERTQREALAAQIVTRHPEARVATSEDGYDDPYGIGIILIVPDGQESELSEQIETVFGFACIRKNDTSA